jgi:hypothetical protein
MIDSLRDYLHDQTRQCPIQKVFLTAVYAAYDWLRLGAFTGSRISEHAQTSTTKNPRTGKRYACVPDSPAAGPWANQPIAFIQTDFVFYSKASTLVDSKFCLLNTALDHIWELHLCFRFDKSATNFTVRKYTRLPGMSFDPVIAAINVIRRACLLGVPQDEPLGQHRAITSSTNSLLCDYDIRDNLQLGCRLAYPNPNHYCRLHILGLVPHSTRVTAALCLKLGGAPDEEIAFRLRWNIASVPMHLRECHCGVDLIMQTAITGVYRTS